QGRGGRGGGRRKLSQQTTTGQEVCEHWLVSQPRIIVFLNHGERRRGECSGWTSGSPDNLSDFAGHWSEHCYVPMVVFPRTQALRLSLYGRRPVVFVLLFTLLVCLFAQYL
ncbi:unnamed protein product, partial [Hapterophycus canaliculatus]